MTIRRQPSDFRVVERLDPAIAASLAASPSATARHAVYLLHKTSLTTPEALSLLGKAVGIGGNGTVEHAGLKDKHACTTQHVSIPVATPAKAAALPERASDDAGRWSAQRLGWASQPATARWIDANSFTIVVRDLARAESDEMARRVRLLSVHDADTTDDGQPAVRFVNYFGAQRFGSARHGQGWIAEKLIAGDFEAALKLAIASPARKDSGKTRVFTRLAATHWGEWSKLAEELPRMPERRPVESLAAGKGFAEAFAELPTFMQSLYLEAFQSHLWNRTAHALVASRVPSDALLATDDEYGEMLFPSPLDVPPQLDELSLPMLAPGVTFQPPWDAAALEALSRHTLTLEMLRVPGFKRPFFGTALRPLFATASAFAMTPAAADDLTPKRLKRTLTFDLPRGAYATVLLRALGQ